MDVEVAVPRLGRKLSYVTIPKVRGVDDVRRVGRLVASAAASSGRGEPLPLHVLIETPQAVHEVNEIAAEPQVEALVFGLMDYVSEHGGLIDEEAMQSPAQFDHRLIAQAKVAIVSAAVRHGKVATHNVCVAVDDPVLAYKDARRAQREFGFQRMWSIHPGQIEPLARGLTPPAERIAYAEAVLLAAYEAAWAPIRFEGRLHDRASYRFYWNLLERAALGGAVLGERARKAFFSSQK
jgi:citrate lyase subunit beta/citryl-CoA lyase